MSKMPWILIITALVSGCPPAYDCAALGLGWVWGEGATCYDPATRCSFDNSTPYPSCKTKRSDKGEGR